MTADEIATALLQQPSTPMRVQKAKNLAQRSKVEWADVQAILDEQGS